MHTDTEHAAAGGVSFVTTVFNKVPYLPRVVRALAQQTGTFAREFVFIDDGSTDGSAEMIARLTCDWTDRVVILRQPNSGASAATNAGVERATLPWIKLLDGDDLLVPGATEQLLTAAQATGHSLAYGDLGTYDIADPDPLADPFPSLEYEAVTDGFARFIRSCPINSSAILVAATRYGAAGGCDERLVSPDAALLQRLFAIGGGAHVRGAVALIPDKAPGRLSEQQRRSRYESVLALYYLVTEMPGLDTAHRQLAYRRALSRAYRFQRSHQGRWIFSGHFWRLLVSRIGFPTDQAAAMYQALAAFTEDGRSERPANWMPGALQRREARAWIGRKAQP